MADVKWIKIVTDVFDDEKMILIESMPEADSIIVIWFKLLCMAGKQNNSGVFMLNDKIAYTDEMLSTIFRRPLNTVRLALKTFETYGMIEVVENVITIPNWEKHQSLDELERKKELNRQRVAAYREKQKLLASAECNAYSNVTGITCNATEKNKIIEEEKEENKNKSKRKKATSRFTPPTYDEVLLYAKERNREDLAKAFFDYFNAGEWVDSKGNAVRNWKQKFITWENRNDKPNGQSTGQPQLKIPSVGEKKYTAEEIAEMNRMFAEAEAEEDY